MEKRLFLFMALCAVVLIANTMIVRWLNPPPVQVAADQDKPKDADQGDTNDPRVDAPKGDADHNAKGVAEKDDAQAAEKDKPRLKAAPAVPAAKFAGKRVSLGSLDPNGSYRMLVTLVNAGAAIERIELNSPKYFDAEDHSGYLGHLGLASLAAPGETGAEITAVGPGSPAAAAGLEVGDILLEVEGNPVFDDETLAVALAEFHPGNEVELKTKRGADVRSVSAVLARRPLEVARPERNDNGLLDQFSYLLTLERLDGAAIKRGEDELPGLSLLEENWEIVSKSAEHVTFRWQEPGLDLELLKTFRLEKLADGDQADPDARAYHLTFDVEIKNTRSDARHVAYQLDGPTGLPTEGWWYLNKIGHSFWGAAGARDIALHWRDGGDQLVTCSKIADGSHDAPWLKPFSYLAVDSQYFASGLTPLYEDEKDNWFRESRPLVSAGPPKSSRRKLTDVSFRAISREFDLTAAGTPGDTLRHSFEIFAGPKRPELLSRYDMSGLVYYGWFGWVSRPMLGILHFFYGVVGKFGVAIVMLTVLVRSCMFPISRKQALSARRMQELQPEMKVLQEKHKGNPEQLMKAQRELWRKHGVNPMAGCLPAFLQLPIFLGLYRSLSVDIELRQAPLFGSGWCSNLAAPDKLFYWRNALPDFLSDETGWFGPYFNLLPILTATLFLLQLKLTTPPPQDEQQAMQQKIMKYMMIFMAFMFFKVASGLCIYFIASNLWSLAERKLLPKKKPSDETKVSPLVAKPTEKAANPGWLERLIQAANEGSNGNGGGAKGKKRPEKGRR